MFVALYLIFPRATDATVVDAVTVALGGIGARLPQVTAELLQRPIRAESNDAQLVWRLCFESEQDYRNCLLEPTWDEARSALGRGDLRVESVIYQRGRHGIRSPEIKNGIWRAMVLSVIEGTCRDKREQYESEMATMPDYIPAIRNWAMSAVLESSGSRKWAYVWEQDFDDVDSILGEYRMHPFHWGVIDRWYDAEHPEHILDGKFLRTLCPSAGSGIDPKRRLSTPRQSGQLVSS